MRVKRILLDSTRLRTFPVSGTSDLTCTGLAKMSIIDVSS